MTTNDKATVEQRFFQPLMDAFGARKLSRSCPGYSDLDHALCGVGRVIENVQSGRDWIQAAEASSSLVEQCRRITKRILQFLHWFRRSLWTRKP